MDIRVEPLPTPIPPTQPYTVCDDDQDGFAQFDLATLTTDILQGATYTNVPRNIDQCTNRRQPITDAVHEH
ncbi:MAG: hypothetical protein R2805_06190 [Flavobacterium sp.]|uniref:hypothetical protein n=1 Tax=Flavobacterium sp. TaxID=239 RepID=UPI0035283390